MSHANDLKLIGGLSRPSKMPCYSWSIPAQTCKLGSLLRRQPNTTCSHCYALKGRYLMPSTAGAMWRRFSTLRWALATPEHYRDFTQAFGRVLNYKLAHYRGGRSDPRYFRWHDSGDLQSAAHFQLIRRVAELTPQVSHWLPTRELSYIVPGKLPSNLTVRFSAHRLDQRPRSGVPSSTVVTKPRSASTPNMSTYVAYPDTVRCPAPTQGGHCARCRNCWDPDVRLVEYELH